ncbi:TadE/TadG family type IV pilus assembly protein [Promicromonospora sp. NFX87]|uniref:TadE/TadG family type IV pilus assembly protein n=1 Tax=Promicromonospora sp. NFX87 TaxID=3402691 RepID=UPI003AFA3EEC
MTAGATFVRRTIAAGRRWRDAVRHDDRGNQALAAVLIYPFLLAFVFGLFQTAFYLHARNVAQHAANGAVQTARLEGATDADGVAAAEVRLDAAQGVVIDPAISVTRTPIEVTATIHGAVPSIIPFIPDWSLDQTASGPVERWIEP